MALSAAVGSSRRRLYATLIGVAPVLWVSSGFADPPAKLRARLVYSVPSSCPGEDRFLEELARHSAVEIDRDARLVVRVEVTRDQKRHRGRVALLTNEEEGAREVVADRCEDVVRGLALFSAIALDAWSERPTTTEPEPVSQPRSAPRAPPEPEREPSSPPPRAVPVKRAPSRERVLLGAGLGQLGATTTRLVRHAGVIGELELPWALQPTVRLSAHVGAVVPEGYGHGTLSFVMAWTRMDACPAWAVLGEGVRVSLCPAAELGLQRAALDSAVVGRSDIRPWATIGGVGRIRASLGPRLDLVASAGALVPLFPFDFRTRTGVAYSTPPVAPVVELDLVVPLF